MLTELVLILVSQLGVLGQPAADAMPQQAADVALNKYSEKQVSGWAVLVHPDAERPDVMRYRRVMAALAFDLEFAASEVPADALAAIRRVKIVVTPRMDSREGLSGRGMCYHDSAGWLTAHGLDAAREGTVEICSMDDFLTWRAEQPLMMLHELAHAYHAMIGFERADVRAAFASAKERGLYRGVGHALASPGEKKDAYALNNEREYFAELSEAYFGRNDYYPYVRAELRAYDPEGCALVERLWGLNREEIAAAGRAAGKGD